jgi:hypothetical protein
MIVQPAYHKETIDHPQHFAKSSLLKIQITPAENVTFLAGSEIYGRMEVFCKGDGGSKGKSELLLGELGVELIGYDGNPPCPPTPLPHLSCWYRWETVVDGEETKEEKGTMRSDIFLQSRRIYQAPYDKSAALDKVTSAMAYPTTTVPDDAGYRQPARANTIFPFRFVLPVDAGSAVEFGYQVRTRYTLTGYAKVRILGSFETLVQSVEVANPVGEGALMVGRCCGAVTVGSYLSESGLQI